MKTGCSRTSSEQGAALVEYLFLIVFVLLIAAASIKFFSEAVRESAVQIAMQIDGGDDFQRLGSSPNNALGGGTIGSEKQKPGEDEGGFDLGSKDPPEKQEKYK